MWQWRRISDLVHTNISRRDVDPLGFDPLARHTGLVEAFVDRV